MGITKGSTFLGGVLNFIPIPGIYLPVFQIACKISTYEAFCATPKMHQQKCGIETSRYRYVLRIREFPDPILWPEDGIRTFNPTRNREGPGFLGIYMFVVDLYCKLMQQNMPTIVNP